MSEARRFVARAGPFDATVIPPGDKSLGHRALLLAAMASGESVVANVSPGADLTSTRTAITRLGVQISDDRVISPGIANWISPEEPLDCGNSGTTMRLLSGALAGSNVEALLVGDSSLSRRPMHRLVGPLQALGADIAVSDAGTSPVRVRGTALTGAEVSISLASAQIRTAVALAALCANGPTRITSPPGFRDHTERWTHHLGLGSFDSTTSFVITPGPIPNIGVTLPADPSSAAFLWAAAAVTPGSRISTPGVSLNRGRTGFLEVLEMMGAIVTTELTSHIMGDAVGDVTIEAGALSGIEIGGDLVVRSLDELPLLAVVAAAANGPTVVTDAEELRAKESDRIASSVALARLAGADARGEVNGFAVVPRRLVDLPAATIDAGGDHRVAMAAAVASLVRRGPVDVTGFSAANVSWPGFASVLEGLWS